jgi:hypothetical protein
MGKTIGRVIAFPSRKFQMQLIVTLIMISCVCLSAQAGSDCKANLQILQKTKSGFLKAELAVALGRYKWVAAVDALIAVLGEPIVGHKAAIALGEIGDRRAVEALCLCFTDRKMGYMTYNAVVRKEAAVALRMLGDARATDALIQALQDEEEMVRAEAARTLGAIGDARAVQPLLKMSADPNEDVSTAADEGLRNIYSRGKGDLNVQLPDPKAVDENITVNGEPVLADHSLIIISGKLVNFMQSNVADRELMLLPVMGAMSMTLDANGVPSIIAVKTTSDAKGRFVFRISAEDMLKYKLFGACRILTAGSIELKVFNLLLTDFGKVITLEPIRMP